MMDAGCYCAHALRFFSGQQPCVESAAASSVVNTIDEGMQVCVCTVVGSRGSHVPWVWLHGAAGLPPLTHSIAHVGLRTVRAVGRIS